MTEDTGHLLWNLLFILLAPVHPLQISTTVGLTRLVWTEGPVATRALTNISVPALKAIRDKTVKLVRNSPGATLLYSSTMAASLGIIWAEWEMGRECKIILQRIVGKQWFSRTLHSIFQLAYPASLMARIMGAEVQKSWRNTPWLPFLRKSATTIVFMHWPLASSLAPCHWFQGKPGSIQRWREY